MQGGAVAVGREQVNRVALGLTFVADFLGQAYRGQRAAGTEPFVIGDGGPFDGGPETARLQDAPLLGVEVQRSLYLCDQVVVG
jgi:hypothetical protein